MRLIDADALSESIKSGSGTELQKFFADVCVATAPTIDAVPVVRCKDCKHWDCYGGEDSHKGDCSELVGLESCMYEDDFCSYGER